MHEYPDYQQHLAAHLARSAKKYADGLQRAGLRPNARLTRAMAQRVTRAAQESYIQEVTAIRDQNIEVIMREGNQHLNEIKRRGAKLRLWACPLIALFFGLLACYSFSQVGGFIMGIGYALAAGVFLAFLVLGAIFDRPS